MNSRDKVTELLKNYRSYKYAVSNGIAPYVAEDNTGMPFTPSYGTRIPGLYRGTWEPSREDWRRYSLAVRLVDGAVAEVLDDNEQDVIRMKYLDRNTYTLARIAERKGYCERQVRRIHKRAIAKLSLALTFADVPEIHNLDDVLKIML